jgi:Type I phosphodiesterase / nucleotide pyrophosphatase
MIGVDAGDVEYIEASAGSLPNLQRVLGSGARFNLDSTADVLTGSVWPTFYTGTIPGDHGVYHPIQWDPAAMRAPGQRRLAVLRAVLVRPGTARRNSQSSATSCRSATSFPARDPDCCPTWSSDGRSSVRPRRFTPSRTVPFLPSPTPGAAASIAPAASPCCSDRGAGRLCLRWRTERTFQSSSARSAARPPGDRHSRDIWSSAETRSGPPVTTTGAISEIKIEKRRLPFPSSK